jgi:hypothetical protein
VKARLVGALLIALLVAACDGDRFRVIDEPVVVGPGVQTFAPPHGLPLHGPRNAITVWLGHAYDGVRPGSRWIAPVRAVLVLTSGERRPLPLTGLVFGREGLGVTWSEWLKQPVPDSAARALEISAPYPITVQSIEWWSGKPVGFL